MPVLDARLDEIYTERYVVCGMYRGILDVESRILYMSPSGPRPFMVVCIGLNQL